MDAKTGKTIELDAVLDDLSEEAIAASEHFTHNGANAFEVRPRFRRLNPEDAADWHLIDDQIGLGLLEFDHIQNYQATIPTKCPSS